MGVIRGTTFEGAKAARTAVANACRRAGLSADETSQRLRAMTQELARGRSAAMAIVVGKKGLRRTETAWTPDGAA